MRQAQIEASLIPWSERRTPVRKSQPPVMAILDVMDKLSPTEAHEAFEQASETLPAGGVYALISMDFEMLDVMAVLGDHYAWACEVGMSSRGDYGVLVMKKSARSDKLMDEARARAEDCKFSL
eukprot:TRINITY_DN47908_c0_g1_i2.p2 TRINITY_DN47908_c0_g1~~TRINITY_DN47908_c0_g1_i2.p2  ORF type:complete len:123 (-),score=25.62 TRINITY_DN47908_c0_g1_i2:46-414(-)